jgi:hypothetical protein
MYKVEIDDIRKKLPSLKDKSDEEIIEEVKNNSITSDDLEIYEMDEVFDESNSLKGSDESNSFEGDILSSDDLDDRSPYRGPFQLSLSDAAKKYIEKNSWKAYLENKLPKYELTIDDDDDEDDE